MTGQTMRAMSSGRIARTNAIGGTSQLTKFRPAARARSGMTNIPPLRVREISDDPGEVQTYPWAVPRQDQAGIRPFAAGRPQRPVAGQSASGLVLPGISSTAGMLGLTPVLELSAWLDNMAKSYLIGREYLQPAEAARGRAFSREDWIAVLLALHPQDEYLHQLAALNHAACHRDLTDVYRDRFLEQVPSHEARAVRAALDGAVDGRPRVFLARQTVLRAMRLVLVPSAPGPAPDPAVATLLADAGPETAAILLAHLAADALAQEIRTIQPRLGMTSESLGMEMIANGLFNEQADASDLLARYRLLWTGYGNRLTRWPAREAPLTLLREAASLDLDDITTLGFAYYAGMLAHQPGQPVACSAFADIPIEAETIEQFLSLFSSTVTDLAAALAECPQPWQMLPIQNRPLLRSGDNLIVLDERYLIERVTRGLYWLVHDYEKKNHGDRARQRWTQAYGEMTETRAEDQLRRMAPRLVGGGSTYFTEEDLLAAFPGMKNCDAGIDFGSEILLAEVVSGTVTVLTRERADVVSFRADTKRLVLEKASQLDTAGKNLLANPQPANSPLTGPARRIFPIIICGGQYPINPVTVSYIDEQITAKRLFADARIWHMGMLDFEELEACQALHQRDNVTILELLTAWQESDYRQASFRSYIWSRYGGQNIGRPDDMRRALAEVSEIIHLRLGPGAARGGQDQDPDVPEPAE